MKRIEKLAALAIVVLLLFRGFIVRILLIPWRVHWSWVEEMPSRRDLATSNQKMFKAYQTYRTGKGKYGLERRSSSTEGTPIVTWILIEDGRVTFVDDGSRELFPIIHIRRPASLEIGFYRFDRPSYPQWIEDEYGTSVSNESYQLQFREPDGVYWGFH